MPSPDEHSRWKGSAHPYAGSVATLATKHRKLPLIGPALEAAVGLRVVEIEIDTDVLGTFTGDVPRSGTPLETAIAKARLGISASGARVGLASEGTIGPDRTMPFALSDEEIVVLVDDDAGLVVWESVTSFEIVAASAALRPGDDADGLLERAGFPGHRLVVRPNSGPIHPIEKGIGTRRELAAAIAAAASASSDGLARVENDLRAHSSPSRQVVIAAAAERLAERLARRCPECFAPGWGPTGYLYGVPCAICETEVQVPRAKVSGCQACGSSSMEAIAYPGGKADPGQCPECNP